MSRVTSEAVALRGVFVRSGHVGVTAHAGPLVSSLGRVRVVTARAVAVLGHGHRRERRLTSVAVYALVRGPLAERVGLVATRTLVVPFKDGGREQRFGVAIRAGLLDDGIAVSRVTTQAG